MSEVYQSLKSMLASLKEQGFKLIVNGGDVFVSETLKDGSAKIFMTASTRKTYSRHMISTRKIRSAGKKYGLLRKIP